MSDRNLLICKDLLGGRQGCQFLTAPDLQISQGQIVLVIGPNGSGKSTLLETLLGVIAPFSGTLQHKATLGFLPSDPNVQEGVDGESLFDILDVKNSRWRSPAITTALGAGHLVPRVLSDVSAGERQRVILSALLQHPADLLGLDEPLTHLDWQYATTLATLIEDQRQQGRSFIITCHDLNWLSRFPEAQIVCLEKGRAIATGFLKDVLTNPKVQDCFYFRSVFVDNPLDGTKILATSLKT